MVENPWKFFKRNAKKTAAPGEIRTPDLARRLCGELLHSIELLPSNS
jgi:hypothetical protein